MARRLAVVNVKRCAACGECSMVCPRSAISIYKGMYAKVDAQLCIGCGLCGRNCPASCIEMGENKNEKEVV